MVRPSTHLGVLWGVIKFRCHGDRSLAIKHNVYDTAVTPKYIVPSAIALKLPTFANGRVLETPIHLDVRTTACGASKTRSTLLAALIRV